MEKKIMLGNEAFARGAYEAGVKVVSSYPGTPSTEVTENAARYDGIHVEWAPNEKVGVEAVSYTHLHYVYAEFYGFHVLVVIEGRSLS